MVTGTQGVAHWLDICTGDLPELPAGVTWKCALYNKATDKRFLGTFSTLSNGGECDGRFTWASGVKRDSSTHKNVPDTTVKNGTANMPVGVYELQLFASDYSYSSVQVDYLDMKKGNILASNSEDDYVA